MPSLDRLLFDEVSILIAGMLITVVVACTCHYKDKVLF